MILIANLLNGLGVILSSLLWMLNLLVFASVIMSWVSADPRNPLVQFVRNTTEPMFYKIRRYLPPMGMLDLSPLVVILILQFLNSFVVQSMFDYATEIKISSKSVMSSTN